MKKILIPIIVSFTLNSTGYTGQNIKWKCAAQCFAVTEGLYQNLGPVSGYSYELYSNTRQEAFDNMIGNCQRKVQSSRVVLARFSTQFQSQTQYERKSNRNRNESFMQDEFLNQFEYSKEESDCFPLNNHEPQVPQYFDDTPLSG